MFIHLFIGVSRTVAALPLQHSQELNGAGEEGRGGCLAFRIAEIDCPLLPELAPEALQQERAQDRPDQIVVASQVLSRSFRAVLSSRNLSRGTGSPITSTSERTAETIWAASAGAAGG